MSKNFDIRSQYVKEKFKESFLNTVIQNIERYYKGESLTADEENFFEELNLSPFKKCVGCGDLLIDIYRGDKKYGRYQIEEVRFSEKVEGHVCGGCWESSTCTPNGTVVFFDPAKRSATKYVVGSYGDETWSGPYSVEADDLDHRLPFEPEGECEESPIQFLWHSIDSWRGYHKVVVPEGWSHLHGDCILHDSDDEKELEKFHNKVRKFLWKADVKFATCFGSTSNLFSTGYDLLVEATGERLEALQGILAEHKRRYRDSDRFIRTTITGSSEKTETSSMMVEAFKLIQKGSSAREAFETITGVRP